MYFSEGGQFSLEHQHRKVAALGPTHCPPPVSGDRLGMARDVELGLANAPDTPNLPLVHTFGPSWSVRLLASPRSVGPAVSLGSLVNLSQHIAEVSGRSSS